jgi:hypothetical protein
MNEAKQTAPQTGAGRNGAPRVVRPPVVPRPAAPPPAALAEAEAASARRWCNLTALFLLGVSGSLNAFACSRHADGWRQLAGALCGASMSVAVWLLAFATAKLYRSGWDRLAGLAGVVSLSVMLSSMFHFTQAFAELTGTESLLSGCVAFTFDCGIAVCKTGAVLVGANTRGERVGWWQRVKKLWQRVKLWLPHWPWWRRPAIEEKQP